MSKKGISINVSGGTAAFGNVVQGDGNTLKASQDIKVEASEAAFAACIEEIGAIQAQAGISQDQVTALTEALAELKAEVDKKGPVAHIAKLAKHIYEQYAWAAKPLGALFAVLTG